MAETWFPPDTRLKHEPEPRFELTRFACEMESRLRHNEHKGAWHNSPSVYLIRKLHEELGELCVALMDPRIHGGSIEAHLHESLRSECAYVANVAMMIFDNSIEGRGL